MQKNVGSIDKILRLVIGLTLLVLPFVMEGISGGLMTAGMVVVGIVLVGTAIFTRCPLYKLLGINTCRTQA